FSSTFTRQFPPSPGSPRKGLLRSTNGGTVFELTAGPRGGQKSFDGLDIYKIIPHTTDRNTFLVAAGSSSALPNSDRAGVWVTHDMGATFTHVLGGEPGNRKNPPIT